jgi:tyrosine-protein kinase Etk/Wzc
MQEETTDYNVKQNFKITPRELILKYLHYLPLVILSVAITLSLAFLKLRYSIPVYGISGKLLVARNNSRGTGDKFDEIFQMQQGSSNNLNNEIEIIRSRFVAARVVKSLGLQLQYINKGKIRASSLSAKDMPFELQIISLKDSSKSFSLLATLVNNDQFRLNEQPDLHYFNQTMSLPAGDFRFVRNPGSNGTFSSNEFIISWIPLEDMSAGLSQSIRVDKVGDFSDVLGLSYETDNTKMGLDVVNSFMLEYQKFGLEDKKQQADNTLTFIKEQLDTVKKELGTVERNLQGYREKNRVFDPEQQSILFFNELSESSKQITDLGLRLKVIEYFIKYITDKKNLYRLVPGTLFIEEPTLIQQITEFNRMQLERETALKTTTTANPLIANLEIGLEKIRNDMLENLDNMRQTYMVALADLNRKSQGANNEIKTIPGKEKELLEVKRQQKILEELFSFLLQKNLETSIASASTISNIKVLEPARVSGPVSPKGKGLYTIALLIGIGIPAGFVLLKEYLNDKVKTRVDVERLTGTPVLGEIGHAEDSRALVVTKNNRQYIAEQFRIIRSNFQYIMPKVEKPVILVTSSFSGEGKSFVSTNLGAVLGVAGKRTVVLEFDIRKPKIMEGLGLNERRGITNFIVGNLSLHEIIYPVPGQDNLFVIPCGPVPPNPAEMLLDNRVKQLIAELKEQFDAIIIDSAPAGLVSDAFSLAAFADATVYIVRHNYTLKKQIQLIDDLYREKKLPHLSIVINDISSASGYGSYYGYGYGYGKDSSERGYFDTAVKSRKRWLFNKK